MEVDDLRKGLRIALAGRGELGELSAIELRGPGGTVRRPRDVLAGGDVVIVKRFRDCASSPSP